MPDNKETPNTYIILQAIVKSISTQDSDTTLNRTVFFSVDKGFDAEWQLNENLVANIFITRGENYAKKFRDNVFKHFAKYENSKNIGLVEVSDIEERSLQKLADDFGAIPSGEVDLKFTTPINFPEPESGRRDDLSFNIFISGFFRRLAKLFDKDFNPISLPNVLKKQKNWRYVNLIKESKTTIGTQKYINGYLGDYCLLNVNDDLGYLLLLMQELHVGTSISYGRGRFTIANFNNSDNQSENILEETPNQAVDKPLYVDDISVRLGVSSNSIVLKTDTETKQLSLISVSEVIILNCRSLSKDFIDKCVEKEIPLIFSSKGDILYLSRDSKNKYEYMARHLVMYSRLEEDKVLDIAREFVLLKISSYIDVFSSKHKTEFNHLSVSLSAILEKVKLAKKLSTMRGYEAEAAKLSYSGLNMMLTDEKYRFAKRDRSAPDIMNSLLNRSSTFLAYRINIHIRKAGLNPFLGFLHSGNNRYESLVYDIIEPFRASLELFCVKLLNYGKITSEDFTDNLGKIGLNKVGYKKFLNNLEQFIQSEGVLSAIDFYVDRLCFWVETGEHLTFLEQEEDEFE